MKKQKKAGCCTGPALEAIESIVIWEGNYTPDYLIIGVKAFSFRVFL
jgi:hypothetical protein